jgi:molybdate transport system substrate-binding protein
MRPIVSIRARVALLAGLSALAVRAADAGDDQPLALRVYAATSLRSALEELAPAAERATGRRLVFNFGASNDLARQIVAANKADLFFSADEGWMNHVAEAGLVDAASRCAPLSNRLVVVVPVASELSIESAADLARPAIRRLSLADPEAVPAGKYARAWLEAEAVWRAVAGRVVPALDARAALAAVESGAVEAGVVYRTDAALSERTRVAYVVPEGDGPSISYALAALRSRPDLGAPRALVEFLRGPDAAPVFERFGFVVRSAPP